MPNPQQTDQEDRDTTLQLFLRGHRVNERLLREAIENQTATMNLPHDPKLSEALENYRLANQRIIEVLTEKRELTAALDVARVTIERQREALKWYADKRTWNQWLPDAAGERARQALIDLPGVKP